LRTSLRATPQGRAVIDTPAATPAQKTLAGLLISLVAIVGITWGAVTLLLFVFQTSLIYLPDAGRDVPGTPADRGIAYREIVIETDDGERLQAWLADAAGLTPEGHGLVLYFHGNAGNLAARLDQIELFHHLGWQTLIISYRGYGRSSGRPGEEGTYRDAAAAWRHATGPLALAPGSIVVFGESLGGGPASWLAAREPVAGIITLGTFTSIPDLGQHLYPWLPVRALARVHYDVAAQLARVAAPLLVIHAREDEMIPFSHAERLVAAAVAARGSGGAPVTLLPLRGDHNNAFRQSAADYRQGVAGFLGSLRADPRIDSPDGRAY
jgi:uncharacterized protein